MSGYPQLRVGEILVDMDLISERQLQDGLDLQQKIDRPLGEVLVEMGAITQEDLTLALGAQQGMETVDLDAIEIPPEVIDKVDPTMATMNRVVPVRFENGVLTVAMADARNVDALDTLRFMIGCEIQGAMSNENAISRALDKYYADRSGGSIEDLLSELEAPEGMAGEIDEGTSTAIDLEDQTQMAESVPVIKLLNLYLLQAIKAQAADIHFEPFEDEFKVRQRIDGTLYDMIPPPRQLAPALIARIKVMANMDISERRLPQDNRIELSIGGNPIDLRVSTLPTKFGESVVMRVLDRRVVALDVEQIGLGDEDRETLAPLIRKPNGIILVTGPTGSGKTTTLYSCLNTLNTPNHKIITTEDPVEYDLEGIVQVQINSEIGVNFAQCLRAILRQDPDIILVGEIRDLETAQIAIQASLTGHLVFSTLHTNDAPQTITRLIDMGLEPFLIAATLEAVVAQRLVRKICRKCREPYEPAEEVLMELELTSDQVKDRTFFVGRGCEECNNTGYRGRIALFEIMVLDDALRDLVTKEASTGMIRDIAREHGMRTLRDSGLLAIYDGTTSIEEVVKATQLAE